MMKKLAVLISLVSLLMSGCSSNVETFNSSQTLGKQLEDLDKAYNANAITEKEYEASKEILINKYK